MKKIDKLNRSIGSVSSIIASLNYNIEAVEEENIAIGNKSAKYTHFFSSLMNNIMRIANKIVARLDKIISNIQNKSFAIIKTNRLSIIKATKLRNNLEKLFE